MKRLQHVTSAPNQTESETLIAVQLDNDGQLSIETSTGRYLTRSAAKAGMFTHSLSEREYAKKPVEINVRDERTHQDKKLKVAYDRGECIVSIDDRPIGAVWEQPLKHFCDQPSHDFSEFYINADTGERRYDFKKSPSDRYPLISVRLGDEIAWNVFLGGVFHGGRTIDTFENIIDTVREKGYIDTDFGEETLSVEQRSAFSEWVGQVGDGGLLSHWRLMLEQPKRNQLEQANGEHLMFTNQDGAIQMRSPVPGAVENQSIDEFKKALRTQETLTLDVTRYDFISEALAKETLQVTSSEGFTTFTMPSGRQDMIRTNHLIRFLDAPTPTAYSASKVHADGKFESTWQADLNEPQPLSLRYVESPQGEYHAHAFFPDKIVRLNHPEKIETLQREVRAEPPGHIVHSKTLGNRAFQVPEAQHNSLNQWLAAIHTRMRAHTREQALDLGR